MIQRLPRAPVDWRERIRHACILASRRDPRGLEILLTALRWRYDTARNEAVKALTDLGDWPSPRLLQTLKSASTAVERRAAADALGLMHSRRAVPLLMRALHDQNMSVRRNAAVALLRIRVSSAVPRIAQMLRDESGGVRILAAHVLGRFRDPRAVPALIRALSDSKWYVRQAAAQALGEISDGRAIKPLRRTVNDARPAVARAASNALKTLAQ